MLKFMVLDLSVLALQQNQQNSICLTLKMKVKDICNLAKVQHVQCSGVEKPRRPHGGGRCRKPGAPARSAGGPRRWLSQTRANPVEIWGKRC